MVMQVRAPVFVGALQERSERPKGTLMAGSITISEHNASWYPKPKRKPKCLKANGSRACVHGHH